MENDLKTNQMTQVEGNSDDLGCWQIYRGEEKKFIGGEQKESSGKLVDNCKSTNCQDSELIFLFSFSLSSEPSHEDSFFVEETNLLSVDSSHFSHFFITPIKFRTFL